MPIWFKKLFKTSKEVSEDVIEDNTPTTHKSDLPQGAAQSDLYVSDAPIKNPFLDRFRRWPFAQRIAQTIIARRDPSSIVVGIYGAWGEGKSTVLNFIEEELGKSPNVICVRFNPWRFTDESLLIRGFFQTLADALGKSLSSQKETIGKWLQDYAAILAPISLTLGGGIAEISPGAGLEKLGHAISSVDLDELKIRIENLLKQEEKRVVFLMDDIDRLDKSEIQSIFKLIKLSADFDYTAYVLAFDEEMVSEAIGERYASGNKEAGRNFLEKIIQVPLHLPVADPISLRGYCFEGIDEALKIGKFNFNEEEIQVFVRHFIDGLEVRLQTPRMCKRYSNALTFSLPILKGEVNIIELMLVEGLRIFYPKLYDTVRNNPDIFLVSQMGYDDRLNNSAKERSLKIIDAGIDNLDSQEKEAVRNLLKALFPRLNGIFGNTTYGNDWDERWSREQRIASREYFHRYFSYAVPEGDLSDIEIDSFLKIVDKETTPDITKQFKKMVTPRNVDVFLLKLRRKEKSLLPAISKKLAMIIALMGDCFPKTEQMFSFTTSFSQAGILVSHLLKNIRDGVERFEVAKFMLIEGQPVTFALECLRWIHSSEAEDEAERTFSQAEEKQLGILVVERIKKTSQEQSIYIQYSKDATYLLFSWAYWGSRDETNAYLSEKFERDSAEALLFLRCYVPTAWGLESGLSFKSDFSRDGYNSVIKVVDAEIVYNAIYKIYGSVLDNPKYYHSDECSLDEKIAQQFAFIHNEIKKERTKEENPNPPSA